MTSLNTDFGMVFCSLLVQFLTLIFFDNLKSATYTTTPPHPSCNYSCSVLFHPDTTGSSHQFMSDCHLWPCSAGSLCRASSLHDMQVPASFSEYGSSSETCILHRFTRNWQEEDLHLFVFCRHWSTQFGAELSLKSLDNSTWEVEASRSALEASLVYVSSSRPARLYS